MKFLVSTLLAAALIAAPAVRAGDTPADANAEVHAVNLALICADCAVVSDTHTETRNGKGSGLGAVGGAVVGGLIGHQIGNGSGQTAATVLGALGGGAAGNAVEKKVKKVTVWITTVTFKDGSTKTYEGTSDPGLVHGDVVTIRNGQPVKHGA